ncbi:MAG TPA: hypothetical protein VNP94_13135, partial [Actinomycetota bacterium]|nr:hypothetical protein [Actinomycetota bacterium]
GAPPLPLPPPPTSRLHAGPTTFGIWGRMALTGLIVLGGPWLAGGAFRVLALFVYLPVYLAVAVPLLVHVWRKEPVVGPLEPVQVVLPEPRALAALRLAVGGVGAALVGVGILLRPGLPLVYLPAAPFLVAALHPVAWESVERGVGRLAGRPVVALALLNALNGLDSLATEAAIRAGHATELNPAVSAFGHGPKLALVAVVGLVLLRARPRALVWPVAALLALAAYHLTGYFGTVGV